MNTATKHSLRTIRSRDPFVLPVAEGQTYYLYGDRLEICI